MNAKTPVHTETNPALERQALNALENAARPVTAAALANLLELTGSRETQRRKVRAIVRALRKAGHRVCANLSTGYWLARSGQEWSDYQAAVKAKACFAFVEISRNKSAATDRANNQGSLFPEKSDNQDWGKR